MRICRLVIVVALGFAAPRGGAEPSPALPVREITAFKDGHALVLRSGAVDVDERGDATLADLPRPVLGTFWARANQANARLASVTAERIPGEATRPATSVEGLLRANVGRQISYRTGDEARTGTIVDVIGDPAPAARPLALIRADDGVAALPIAGLRDVRFIDGPPALELTGSIERERMTLDLDWDGRAGGSAEIALMYLQRGLRWIPSYRITMLDGGRARVELQATVVNELTDLDDVIMHFAVGVPKFAFAHTPDPMALREQLDSLGLYFRRATEGQTGGMLSNAIMAQRARMSEHRTPGAGAAQSQPPAPALDGAERAEDLYVFSVRNVSLAKGARMVLQLASYDVPFESVYRLDLPAGPPVQALRRLNSEEQRRIAEQLERPVVRHVLRLRNQNPHGHPITTAPALVIRHGRALAQGLIGYASPGATVDLEVGAAVDIGVETREVEDRRVPNALRWDDDDYMRVDIAFGAEITNRKPEPVRIEVRKLAFGLPDQAGQGGEASALSVFAADVAWAYRHTPWWRHYSWPYYWHRLNGAAQFRWTIDLEPGAATTLEASWHYFWD